MFKFVVSKWDFKTLERNKNPPFNLIVFWISEIRHTKDTEQTVLNKHGGQCNLSIIHLDKTKTPWIGKKRTLSLGWMHLSKGICALILGEWWKKRIFLSCQIQKSDQKIFVKPEKVGITVCTPPTQWQAQTPGRKACQRKGGLRSPLNPSAVYETIQNHLTSREELRRGWAHRTTMACSRDGRKTQSTARWTEPPGFMPPRGMWRARLDPGERRSAITARSSGKWHQFDKGPLLLSFPWQAWCESRWEAGRRRREGQGSSGGENGKTLNWRSTWIYQD